VALLPAISVENEIARRELIRVPVLDLHFQRELRLVHRQESTVSHAGRAFLRVAEQFAKERGGHYRFQREK
jgi:DNA-binding transcriptional LysR family regulator